ncbi:unnamed protein product [Litomosoides sigmodontis]|uniref:Uncharacterized protein n=1 Tax=Litomosoides sigmodontis TaxID=42156 RepID=A0A3P6T0J4_LITSI|nr:unnamed protein product [Litomosoides sigmodontis]
MSERGVYFASVPLTDAQFRLTLEYSEPVVDVLQSFDDFAEGISKQHIPRPSTILAEQCTFRWQQKLHFGRNKLTTMPQSQTGSCPKQDSGSQDEVTTEKDGSRVFTLIDGEEPAGIRKETAKLNIHTGESSLAERIALFRNGRIQPAMMSHRKPIIDLPPKEHQIKTRSVQCNKQIMYVMAYLGPVHDNTQMQDESNQHVLCKMTAVNGTNIIIEPDLFSVSNMIESRYGIYKARLSVVSSDRFDRVDDASSADQLWFEKAESDMMSDFPAEKTTKLVYLIDIERAVNFPHDGLCIEYNVDLPLQCTLIDLSPEQRWSIVSDSIPQAEDDVAVLSQPVCATIIMKEEPFSDNFYWPRMTFRFCGEDYWGRFFVNGFGQLTLPSQPGRHQFDIKCWQYERKHDRKGMLFENFISQTADFKQTELTLASESITRKEGPIASSIGLNVTSSGILKVNVQCVMQSRAFISREFFYKMKYGALLRHDRMQSRIHWNILEVLSKFEEARRNLLEIRNQLIPTAANRIS